MFLRYSRTSFFAFVFIGINTLFAQVPFTTTVTEKYSYYIEADPSKEYGTAFLRNSELKTQRTANEVEIRLDSVGALFFRNNSLGGDIISGSSIVRMSSNVLYYKLYFYGSKTKDKRYFFPLLIVSRLASKYDSANVTSAIDALDYEGSPISIRLMPSWKKKVGDENQIFYGLIADYRGLNIVKSPGNYKYEQGFYCAGGFTYGGNGSGQELGSGEVTPGVWTFSALVEFFTSSSSVISEMYDTKENYVLSAQGIFNFFAGKDSGFNIKAGAQYFFSDPLNAQKFSLKLAIGSK
jgi:hypothetical protein